MDDEQRSGPAEQSALRGLAGAIGRQVGDRLRQELDAARSGDDPQPIRRAAAETAKGLAGDLGSRARDAAGAAAGDGPTTLGGFATAAGQGIADLLRRELGAARTEALQSARAAGLGAALLGGAAAAGNAAVLFTGVALWQGLGAKIGPTRSAIVVAAVSGGATAVLATRGVAELARVQRRRRRVAPPASGADGTRPPTT